MQMEWYVPVRLGSTRINSFVDVRPTCIVTLQALDTLLMPGSDQAVLLPRLTVYMHIADTVMLMSPVIL